MLNTYVNNNKVLKIDHNKMTESHWLHIKVLSTLSHECFSIFKPNNRFVHCHLVELQFYNWQYNRKQMHRSRTPAYIAALTNQQIKLNYFRILICFYFYFSCFTGSWMGIWDRTSGMGEGRLGRLWKRINQKKIRKKKILISIETLLFASSFL